MNELRARVLLRIPAKLKAKLTEFAEREHRSLNKQIESMLEWAIEQDIYEETRELQRSRVEPRKRK